LNQILFQIEKLFTKKENKSMIKMLDLQKESQEFKEDVLLEITKIVDDQSFILGSSVERFESELASYLPTKYVVGVSSGTDALLVALMAMGVKQDDEVIVPSMSFFATAGVVARLGAKPIFVDIDPKTLLLDQEKCKNAITKKTKAIIPVHLFGQICDLGDLYNQNDVYILEDSAQALGAKLNNKGTGSFGHLAATSFFPSKNLGCFGDGGAVYGNNEELLSLCKTLRVHGANKKYYHSMIGGNFRLDAIQASILSVKLKHLERWTKTRRLNAEIYAGYFRSTNLVEKEFVQIPNPTNQNNIHVFNQYTLRVKNRDLLKDYLTSKGIETTIYYPLPLHLQQAFSYLGYQRGSLVETEKACDEVLSIPMNTTITISEQAYIVDQINNFYKTI
jgi:dTDP-4-amino-4,6-dideoxygalactose transaminase